MPIPFTTDTGSRKGQWPKTSKQDSGWYFLPQLLEKRSFVSLQSTSCWWKPGISSSHHVEKVSYRMNQLREQKSWEMERKGQFSVNEIVWAPNSAVPEGSSVLHFLFQEPTNSSFPLCWFKLITERFVINTHSHHFCVPTTSWTLRGGHLSAQWPVGEELLVSQFRDEKTWDSKRLVMPKVAANRGGKILALRTLPLPFLWKTSVTSWVLEPDFLVLSLNAS